ncbi:CPBP family intramembrane glutamic endopeptidase [Streptococcus ovis]|uniref:CPBP family intramembrane glutamic endopeptidase n=1 Tax=Streptococcus ovis TaxID=82806 RepID=UPI000373F52D|nr:type II CAAX endopeptidase family protein [Streptococcus ovis]
MKGSLQKVSLGIILSIVILGLAQTIAISFAESSTSIGLPSVLAIVLSAVLYIGLTVLGLSILSRKILSYSLADIRILPVKLPIFWSIVAVTLPIFVLVPLYLTGGHVEIGEVRPANQGIIIAQTILFYGLAVGIVEEMVFRGMFFTLLEKQYNRALAVWLPSCIFGFLHIIGGADGVFSMVQVLIAGTLVGVLFSLITMETGSIWSSALVHGIWNCIFVGDVLHIGEHANPVAMINFVLSSRSPLLTGGDFGAEASIWAILAYLFFSLLAWWKKQHSIG